MLITNLPVDVLGHMTQFLTPKESRILGNSCVFLRDWYKKEGWDIVVSRQWKDINIDIRNYEESCDECLELAKKLAKSLN